jgi:hypothetical protein
MKRNINLLLLRIKLIKEILITNYGNVIIVSGILNPIDEKKVITRNDFENVIKRLDIIEEKLNIKQSI